MCTPLATGGPKRILCDGDSTTLGTGGSVNGAYRRFLAEGPLTGAPNGFWDDNLVDYYALEFVGGVSDASHANSWHWGHAGTTIEDHDTGGAEDADPYLNPANPQDYPDICIRQLGVNNLSTDTPAQAAAKMLTLLTNDHAIRPDIIWILCTITPHETGATDLLHQQYNTLLTETGGIWDQFEALGATVFRCDLHAALDPDLHLTSGAHPNDTGYQLEADALWPVIQQAVGRTV